MKVILLNYTPDPDLTVAIAARLCYSKRSIEELKKELTPDKLEKFITRILRSGHHSVLEHASFTFGIEGISRVTTHQLIRHRLASYSQQSQRYTKLEDQSDFILPESIKQNDEFRDKFTRFSEHAFSLYHAMINSGIPVEDARYILPSSVKTRIIVTMNARELLHFFRLRGCLRAQWEIRELSVEMLKLSKKTAPVIFKKAGPACMTGPCTEGDFYGGKLKEIREFYRGL